MRNRFIAFIIIITAFSCTKDYDLQLKSDQSRLVVESTITNQKGPYMLYLTKSLVQMSFNANESRANTEYVNDADIYITDINQSVTDTLVKYWSKKRFMLDNANNPFIDPSDSIYYYGQYQTTKLKGIPGHTYSLTIKWQNQEYHAESYMPPVPPLDSVQFKFTEGAVGKSDYNIPLIYFKEPQNERNYYLFKTQAVYGWPYSILSDEYLKNYVNGLDVCKGVTPDYWVTNYPYDFIDSYFIEMHSITKEGYDYYKALIQQYKTDGGGYSPSPASPPTNLDNGALGFFRASAVNRVDFKKDENHEWVW